MRIAQLCPYDIDKPGGVQRHILDLAAALRERGHTVTVIAPRVSSDDHADGQLRIGQARRIGFGGTAFEISIALGAEYRRLRQVLGSFDVVHYHTIWTPVMPLQALRLSHAANVATFHDTPATNWARSVFRLMGRWLLPRLDGAIAVSEAPALHLEPPPGLPFDILPPSTDLRRFMGRAAPLREYCDGRVNILFFGRLEPRKGAIVLLEAYQRLCAEGLPVRLLVVGDGELGPALRRFVTEYSLPDVVFAGAVSDSDAPRWYATGDIFCAPSLYGESFGIVLTEAMATGRPVVAAANLGYRTVLTGEAARFLTPPGDVTATTSALRELVQDAGLRQRLGAWGRGEALRHDCRTLAPRFEALYDRALAIARRAT